VTALKERATIIDALGTSLSYGGQALNAVPDLLRRVLEEEAWREFVTKLGEHVNHESLVDFVTEPPLAGLGATVDLLERVVKGTPAEDALDAALKKEQPHGGNRKGKRGESKIDNVQVDPPSGNRATTALRRLRKDRPDLHALVLSGKVSAHAAMIAAGFRRPTISVPTDSPERIAATLRRRLDPETLGKVRALLSGEVGQP
jgi:hypothetical protein